LTEKKTHFDSILKSEEMFFTLPGGAAIVSALPLYVCGNGGGSPGIQRLSSQTEIKIKKNYSEYYYCLINQEGM
jgi:hypothetical protein